jgi:HEAT repeat protein
MQVVDSSTNLAALIGDKARNSWLQKLARGSTAQKLTTLEQISATGLSDFLPVTLAMMTHPASAVRGAAAHCSAALVGAMPPGDKRLTAIGQFAYVLNHSSLPKLIFQEALLLTKEAAPRLIACVLVFPTIDIKMAQAALEAAGRLGLVDLAPLIARYLTHKDENVRCAAVKALAQLRYVPPRFYLTVQTLAVDPHIDTRIAALHALVYVYHPVSFQLMARAAHKHDSRWVRAAANELLKKTVGGSAGTRRAVQSGA